MLTPFSYHIKRTLENTNQEQPCSMLTTGTKQAMLVAAVIGKEVVDPGDDFQGGKGWKDCNLRVL
jgi:hypothetical protein